METKNNVIVIGLLTLILGLVIGYFVGMGQNTPQLAINTGMHDAMSEMTMGLEGKTGDALDEAFLDGMIIHHEGATEMAQTLLQGTKRPELIKLGNDIITAQMGEIKMMEQWRKEWFNR